MTSRENNPPSSPFRKGGNFLPSFGQGRQRQIDFPPALPALQVDFFDQAQTGLGGEILRMAMGAGVNLVHYSSFRILKSAIKSPFLPISLNPYAWGRWRPPRSI